MCETEKELSPLLLIPSYQQRWASFLKNVTSLSVTPLLKKATLLSVTPLLRFKK